VEKADAELADVEAEFRISADGTAAEQQRIVDDLLTKGSDGIAISPVASEPDRADRCCGKTYADLHAGQRCTADESGLLYRHRQCRGRPPGGSAHS
jgi:hypothetical protein